MMQDASETKTKRTTKRLVIILIVIIVVMACVVIRPFILSLFVREYRTIKNVPEPVQISTNGSTTISGSNWSAGLTYLATYEIQGLVVGVADYSTNSLYDRVAPRDISIAWGDMAANSNLISWERGVREMSAEVNAFSEWIIGKKYEQLVIQYSNNHLIPKDESILSQLSRIKRGDYIRLKGFLVNATIRDKNDSGAYYVLNSSTVRNDSGDSACEVMYVTEVEYLD